MTDDIIDFPEFAAAARSLGLAPWQERALDILAGCEDGPRSVAEWCAELKSIVSEETELLVQQVRDISEAVRREREGKGG